MTSDAITPKKESIPQPPIASSNREFAPSFLREDEPTLPRAMGSMGAALVIFGGMALIFNLSDRPVRVSTGWAIFSLTLGLCGLLFHAAFDRDVQLRRLYMIFGYATLALGLILCFLPTKIEASAAVGALTVKADEDAYYRFPGNTFRWGVPCLLIGLLFLVSFLRNEDAPNLRDIAQKIIGVTGGSLAIIGLLGGNVRAEFFLPMGVVFSLVGLIYITALVGSRGISDDLGYYSALGLAGLGLLFAIICLLRSLFSSTGADYFVGVGVLLFLISMIYLAVGAGLALDWPIFVMTRRELGAFFYSPIAYLTLLGFTLFSWFSFLMFFQSLFADMRLGMPPPIEPIVRNYIFALYPVFTVIFVVPVLTMRLLSEEQRTGTMEVLLTAPVDEPVIVFSKFLAALITYLIVWIPFGLFLLAIPMAGGNPFDYRPLISFLVALVVTGAGFVSMGLFFSSLTKNQVASGVLTFAGMLALTYTFFAARDTRDAAWETVLRHVSYLDTWQVTLQGEIVLRSLLFYISLTVLFLFMTIKVLESRKWR